jgi:hypothetical protein
MANHHIDGTLTAEKLRKALDYDPETGAFTWRFRDDVCKGANTRFAGKPAGCLTPSGNVNIGVYGPLYMAQRLAWLHVHGEWPPGSLEHIDGDKTNNALANLRLVSDRAGEPTPARIRETFDYDPDTGLFYYREQITDTRKRHRAGKQAGCLCKTNGYVIMTVDKQQFKAHRVAWLFMYGAWPAGLVDHINGNRADNRAINLRLATPTQNNINRGMAPTNTSGMKGASWSTTSQKWLAHISYGGKTHHLGFYATAQEAHAAYLGAAKILHGEFARTA